jgi:N-acetylneuraminic acid mutarotase
MPMNNARQNHSSVTLNDGRVIVIGGNDTLGYGVSTNEVFNPTNNQWVAIAPLLDSQTGGSIVLLKDGRILNTGGGKYGGPHASEIYDPVADAWTYSGYPIGYHECRCAIVLNDGRVLTAGGAPPPNTTTELSSSEVYDPATGQWAATGPLNFPASGALVLLNDGRAFAAGGGNYNSAEVFDPILNTWLPVAPPLIQVKGSANVVLSSGQVLLAGGVLPNGLATSVSQLYDPTSNTWSMTAGSLTAPSGGGVAALLPDGSVLMVGGSDNTSGVRISSGITQIYDPSTGLWVRGPDSPDAASGPQLSKLQNGNLLVTGGLNINNSVPGLISFGTDYLLVTNIAAIYQ